MPSEKKMNIKGISSTNFNRKDSRKIAQIPIKAANLTGSLPKKKPVGRNTIEDFNSSEAFADDSDEDTPTSQKMKVIVRIRPFLDQDDTVQNKQRTVTQNSGCMHVDQGDNKI